MLPDALERVASEIEAAVKAEWSQVLLGLKSGAITQGRRRWLKEKLEKIIADLERQCSGDKENGKGDAQ